MNGTNKIKKITGNWFLKNAYMPKTEGKVFSCFSCCGGSTMGYKLAGFDVIGCNEIDPKVIEVYKANHHPKYAFNCSVRDLLKMKSLPDELFNLDILDGSPPCTSFSMVGVRERDWGKTKKFSEGQALQRLDDLFFEFIDLANRLKPKVIVAENVSGIIKGKAKGYVKEIIQAYSDAGYNTQIFKLNASTMGVPQKRERIFFLSHRKDLSLQKIKLTFNEKSITFGQVVDQVKNMKKTNENISIFPSYLPYYKKCKPGENLGKYHPKGSYFSKKVFSKKRIGFTLCGSYDDALHPEEERFLNTNEWLLISTFPNDFEWKGWNHSKKKWAMGMSVPPFMMQRIAIEINKQWLNHASKKEE